MDDLIRRVMAQLPLAEAVMSLWRWTMSPERLQQIWDENRGRCYDKVISFPVMVHLIADALVNYHSGRESFRKNREQEVLEASIQAAYKKLSRLPLAVSQAFLLVLTEALLEVFPEWGKWQRPASLRGLRIATYDGKSIKRVAKRLKQLRGARGGLLGGKALVVTDWDTGMAIAMHAHPDGEANDVRFVQHLVPVVHAKFDDPVLHVADAGFCDLEQPRHFTARPGDHFLVRQHPKLKFHQDKSIKTRRGVSHEGISYVEMIGWIGSENDGRRRRARRIELQRGDEKPVALITDLLDPDCYPAEDLLFVYRERWDIERMFQKVTEVFGLSHLIGSTPEATIFQFAFCMVLYNMTLVIRAFVAQEEDREPSEISTELMSRDVERQLIACNTLFEPQHIEDYFGEIPTTEQLCRRLEELLATVWTDTWLASPPQAVHRQTPRKRTKSHNSVHRLLFGPPPKKKRKNLAQPRCLQQ